MKEFKDIDLRLAKKFDSQQTKIIKWVGFIGNDVNKTPSKR